jgi:UDP-N-acetylglucosamine--N-acetylmuramyl-(pentapeptide) pyrophosphoryl-undecaprenol N-acetylglucosamine transferase
MMVRAGAARLLGEEALTGESLAKAIVALQEEPERRRSMAENARGLARPDAARMIAERLLVMAGVLEEAHG